MISFLSNTPLLAQFSAAIVFGFISYGSIGFGALILTLSERGDRLYIGWSLLTFGIIFLGLGYGFLIIYGPTLQ